MVGDGTTKGQIMLVDLPEGALLHRDPVTEILTGPDYSPAHVARGVYLTHYNFSHDIRHLIVSEYPFNPIMFGIGDLPEDEQREIFRRIMDPDWPDDYGVCDSWEQITRRWPVIETDPRSFVISLAEVRREDQSESGGWRWHKWGTYIGDHDPQCEYLYDEDPSIERVFCWHLLEVQT